MGSHQVFNGMTACITGASSGMGRAIAEHLGHLGAHVFLSGRSPEPMGESAATIRQAGGSADVSVFDVTDSEALTQWITNAADSTGRLDIMVNNAGLGDVGSTIIDGDPKMWSNMLNINVLALAIGCQSAIRAMRTTSSMGTIINISSVAAIRRESGIYGATKHAVNTINASLRKELENDSIRVTSIMPGVFATNFMRHADRSMIEGMAAFAGIDSADINADARLSNDQLSQIQEKMSSVMGDVEYIARAVEYIISQPAEINIEELVIRPGKSLF